MVGRWRRKWRCRGNGPWTNTNVAWSKQKCGEERSLGRSYRTEEVFSAASGVVPQFDVSRQCYLRDVAVGGSADSMVGNGVLLTATMMTSGDVQSHGG